MIPVLGSQPTGDQSHKPGGGLPLLSARFAVASPAPEHQRVAENLGTLGPRPLGWGYLTPIKTRYSPRVLPYQLSLLYRQGQFGVGRGPETLGDVGASPLGRGHG